MGVNCAQRVSYSRCSSFIILSLSKEKKKTANQARLGYLKLQVKLGEISFHKHEIFIFLISQSLHAFSARITIEMIGIIVIFCGFSDTRQSASAPFEYVS